MRLDLVIAACLSLCLCASCDPSPSAHNPKLTTSADSLSFEEGSAEVVKSFLEWYEGHQHDLMKAATQPDGTAAWRATLGSSGFLHPDFVESLQPASATHPQDALLLTDHPEVLLKDVDHALPIYEDVLEDTDVVKVTLAAQTLLYEVISHEGKRKISSVRLPGQRAPITKASPDGEWESTSNSSESTFSLRLQSRGTELRGWVCSLAERGNKIDCMLEKDGISLTGSWDGQQAEVNVVSAHSGNAGKALITLQGPFLHWQLTQPPEGEHYLVEDCLMERLTPKQP